MTKDELEKLSAEALSEFVRDKKALEAKALNDAGRDSQITYLLSQEESRASGLVIAVYHHKYGTDVWLVEGGGEAAAKSAYSVIVDYCIDVEPDQWKEIESLADKGGFTKAIERWGECTNEYFDFVEVTLPCDRAIRRVRGE